MAEAIWWSFRQHLLLSGTGSLGKHDSTDWGDEVEAAETRTIIWWACKNSRLMLTVAGAAAQAGIKDMLLTPASARATSNDCPPGSNTSIVQAKAHHRDVLAVGPIEIVCLHGEEVYEAAMPFFQPQRYLQGSCIQCKLGLRLCNDLEWICRQQETRRACQEASLRVHWLHKHTSNVMLAT